MIIILDLVSTSEDSQYQMSIQRIPSACIQAHTIQMSTTRISIGNEQNQIKIEDWHLKKGFFLLTFHELLTSGNTLVSL